MTSSTPGRSKRRVSVVLSVAAFSSFVSVWKAAALSIAELGVGAFFTVGVAFEAVGGMGPWCILGAALVAIYVRAIDIESWSVFVPGGISGRAERAFGARAGRVAAAAVLTERLLLSALASAVIGRYAATLFVSISPATNSSLPISDAASLTATLLVGVLWIRARLGSNFNHDIAARCVWIGAGVLGLVAIFGLFGPSTHDPARWAPLVAAFSKPARSLAFLTLFGAFLALPAIGGGDGLTRTAQDLPPPRLQALRRVSLLVVLFTAVATVIPAFLFGLFPDGQQALWVTTPLLGVARTLAVASWIRTLLNPLVVAAAFLMLTPAAHSAMVDAAQIVRRLARERALPEALASPHPRFGTFTYAIDVTAAVTVLLLVVSGGRVEWLARVYAFSIASTLLVKIATTVRLRRIRPDAPPFKAPFNVRIGRREIPLGLLATGLLMVAVVGVTLAAGDPATIAAVALLSGLALLVAAPVRSAEASSQPDDIDVMELLPSTDLPLGHVDARPGNLLVPVRNPHSLSHVAGALQAAGDRDVVVMTVRLRGIDIADTEDETLASTEPTPEERELFSRVIALAERYGRSVRLVIVPAGNVFDAVAATILHLRSAEVYVGESASLSAADQARLLGDSWERMEKPDGLDVRLVIYHHSGRTDSYHLGAHPPALTSGDLDLIHRVWLDAVKAIGPHVHHRDVVRAALIQMEQQLSGPQRDGALDVVRHVARPADELAAAIHARDFSRLRDMTRNRPAVDLAELLADMAIEDEVVFFRVLPRKDAAAVFEYLSLESQESLLKAMAQEDIAALLNNMAPDDRTMFLEELPAAATRQLLSLLTPAERAVALTLLGYPDDSIGRLMTPHYVAVREHWTVREVLDYIRSHGQDSETLNVIYVVDEQGLLIDDVRIREFLLTSLDNHVSDLMDRRFIALKATDDQHTAVAAFRNNDRTALPVTDSAGMLIGIVTIDDVLNVAEAAATEEIQRFGGSEALDEPYTEISFPKMIRKRAGWLTALFLGEMLTATAMGAFEAEISKAVVLALFVPLIISSGGNSGSQASTLVIRALALGEVGLTDWWQVMRREILAGLSLGGILGSIGFFRITIWSAFSNLYGEHWLLVAITVAVALVGIVLWGTLVGSLLPFLLRRLGFDPATSSAPFVATLVDVTGLVIYFTVALVILHGTLL